MLVMLRGWAPFALLLVAYEVMRDLAAAVGLPAHDLASLDRTLFDGYQPTLVLQAAVGGLSDADVFEDMGSLVYATHFLLPIAVGAWLWTKDRGAFRTFGITLVVLCGLAFATYVVAAAAAWRQSRKVGVVLWVWAVIVWFAVVYLGEHYASDVIGGAVYAAIAIAISRTLAARPRRINRRSPA